jgi:hypothetical protein
MSVDKVPSSEAALGKQVMEVLLLGVDARLLRMLLLRMRVL